MILLTGIVGFSVALVSSLVLFEVGARRVYDYTITSTDLVVRLFGRFPIYHIAFADMAQASLWTPSLHRPGSVFTTLRIGNRIIGRAVVIKRRSGFPRYVVVTPDDPVHMVSNLQATIGRS